MTLFTNASLFLFTKTVIKSHFMLHLGTKNVFPTQKDQQSVPRWWNSFGCAFIRLSVCVCVFSSGSVWLGLKVSKVWWGRLWTTSCRPSSGSPSTWTSWFPPCCSTCRMARSRTGAPLAQLLCVPPQGQNWQRKLGCGLCLSMTHYFWLESRAVSPSNVRFL